MTISFWLECTWYSNHIHSNWSENCKNLFPGCQQNAASPKSWETQVHSVTKRRTLSKQKVVYIKMFSCSDTQWYISIFNWVRNRNSFETSNTPEVPGAQQEAICARTKQEYCRLLPGVYLVDNLTQWLMMVSFSTGLAFLLKIRDTAKISHYSSAAYWLQY